MPDSRSQFSGPGSTSNFLELSHSTIESTAHSRGPTAIRCAAASTAASVPPAGKFLNPRVAGYTLAFQVKDDDGKLVDFRLTIQAPDAATVNVTRYSAVYPEFQMKRVQ